MYVTILYSLCLVSISISNQLHCKKQSKWKKKQMEDKGGERLVHPNKEGNVEWDGNGMKNEGKWEQ